MRLIFEILTIFNSVTLWVILANAVERKRTVRKFLQTPPTLLQGQGAIGVPPIQAHVKYEKTPMKKYKVAVTLAKKKAKKPKAVAKRK